MAFSTREPASLGTVTIWAATGMISADAVRGLGAVHLNLIRHGSVTDLRTLIVLATGEWLGPSLQPDLGHKVEQQFQVQRHNNCGNARRKHPQP